MVLFSRSFLRKRMIPLPDYSEEQPFLSENDIAMNEMMANMTIKPTGDLDRDFVAMVAMMVSHHQGAVDMANAELKYGHDEQLRRLAEEIVAWQQQEIVVMRNAASDGHVSDGQLSAAQSPVQPRGVVTAIGPD